MDHVLILSNHPIKMISSFLGLCMPLKGYGAESADGAQGGADVERQQTFKDLQQIWLLAGFI